MARRLARRRGANGRATTGRGGGLALGLHADDDGTELLRGNGARPRMGLACHAMEAVEKR